MRWTPVIAVQKRRARLANTRKNCWRACEERSLDTHDCTDGIDGAIATAAVVFSTVPGVVFASAFSCVADCERRALPFRKHVGCLYEPSLVVGSNHDPAAVSSSTSRGGHLRSDGCEGAGAVRIVSQNGSVPGGRRESRRRGAI